MNEKLVLSLVMLIAGPAVAQVVPSSTSEAQAQVEEVMKAERERLQAGVRKDVTAIAAATADDYMQIDADGHVLNKAAALERIGSNYARMQSNPVDDLVVRVYGDTAVLTARGSPQGVIDSKPASPLRYTRVYVKRDGRWQVVLFQQTRIAAGPEPAEKSD